MTNSEQAIRKFAEKIVPVIINASVLCNTEEIIEAFTGDLTALIEEHYVEREEHDKVVQQRDELMERCKQLEFMIEKGLGWDDIKNDITMPHEL